MKRRLTLVCAVLTTGPFGSAMASDEILEMSGVKGGDTIFAAGPRDTVDERAAFKTFNDPTTRDNLKRQAELFAGNEGACFGPYPRKTEQGLWKPNSMCCQYSTA